MTSKTLQELQALAHRALTINAQVEELTSELKGIKATLASELVTVGKHPLGSVTVTLSPNRRLNTSKLEEAYPVAQHPGLYKPAIDTAAAKKELGADEYEGYYTEGAPKVLFS